MTDVKLEDAERVAELIELVTGGEQLSTLPAPRLQLTWQKIPRDSEGYCLACHYHLVMPVGKYDIRNPREYKSDSFILLDLGGTRSTGSIDSRVYADGKIDRPFRDGSHIAWDSHLLKLPAFVVCGQQFNLIDPRAPERNA